MTQAEVDRLRRVYVQFCDEWPTIAFQIDDLRKCLNFDQVAVLALLTDVVVAMDLHDGGMLFDDLTDDE